MTVHVNFKVSICCCFSSSRISALRQSLSVPNMYQNVPTFDPLDMDSVKLLLKAVYVFQGRI